MFIYKYIFMLNIVPHSKWLSSGVYFLLNFSLNVVFLCAQNTSIEEIS